MEIISERAKEIEAYITSLGEDAEIGKWPLEIGGKKQILPFYALPIKDFLRFSINNGRIVVEVKQWEEDNGRRLDPCDNKDHKEIHKILLSLNEGKTKELKEDLKKKGQMEPGVITFDGFVINGNRRMAVIEELHEENPSGKYERLDVIRLPENISEKDLWRIEAGLQLSKDKVAEYGPVKELLKIRQGKKAGLTNKEIAAAMYGRDLTWVEDSLERLELIDQFLEFWGAVGNYGLIETHGLSEYFIDTQQKILGPKNKRSRIPKREMQVRLTDAFHVIRANILQTKGGKKRKDKITHWDFRKLGKVFEDPYAKEALEENIKNAIKPKDLKPEQVIEDFKSAVEIVEMTEERNEPIKLINKAMKALNSINRDSNHFHGERVKTELGKLKSLVIEMDDELHER